MRRLGCLLSLIALLAVSATSAGAAQTRADSNAPAGATTDWLPSSTWVQQRWMPFNEAAFEKIVGVDEQTMIAQIDSTGNTLANLAIAHHTWGRDLPGRLVAASWGKLTPARRAVLRARTLQVLTQSHLSEHLLRHEFHTPAVWQHTDSIFGVSYATYKADLIGGMDHTGIAGTAGVDPGELAHRVTVVSAAAGLAAVRRHEMTAAENSVLRARDQTRLAAWLIYRYRPAVASMARISRPSAMSLCMLG